MPKTMGLREEEKCLARVIPVLAGFFAKQEESDHRFTEQGKKRGAHSHERRE